MTSVVMSSEQSGAMALRHALGHDARNKPRLSIRSEEGHDGDAHCETPTRACTSSTRAAAIHEYRTKIITSKRQDKAPDNIDRKIIVDLLVILLFSILMTAVMIREMDSFALYH